jgi:hypothetical protein
MSAAQPRNGWPFPWGLIDHVYTSREAAALAF